MTFGNFPLNLLSDLTRQAKRANEYANYRYSCDVYDEDAFADSVATARLVDLGEELTVEVEDEIWEREHA